MPRISVRDPLPPQLKHPPCIDNGAKSDQGIQEAKDLAGDGQAVRVLGRVDEGHGEGADEKGDPEPAEQCPLSGEVDLGLWSFRSACQASGLGAATVGRPYALGVPGLIEP
jgi:hypothetical protein